jgi:hypothetical protein
LLANAYQLASSNLHLFPPHDKAVAAYACTHTFITSASAPHYIICCIAVATNHMFHHLPPLIVQAGCSACHSKPLASRPFARWRPDAGRVQLELPEAPTFRPTAEEFADPFGYIMAVYEEIAKQHGVCKIVPPQGWVPPRGFDLQQGLQFAAQRQFVSHLCMRQAVPGAAALAGVEQQDAGDGR